MLWERNSIQSTLLVPFAWSVLSRAILKSIVEMPTAMVVIANYLKKTSNLQEHVCSLYMVCVYGLN
jgi:hypothetical protein